LSDGNRIERTVVAFSNDAGGEIYLGIKNDPREIIGYNENEIFKLEQQLSNIIFDNSQPNIVPDVAVVNYQGMYLLKITVYPGSQTPYFIKSLGKSKGTYIRVGSSNKPADESILQELERRKRNISFDSLPFYELSADDLNLISLSKLFQEQTGKKFDKKAYEKLGLIFNENGKGIPTVAAVLLSDSEIKAKEFHYSKIECARFKGSTTSGTLDSQTINESVCLQPDLAMNFIKRNIRKGSEIKGVYRKERWEYPIAAIREVIINAIIHRDYSLLGRDIKIAIFDDMLEITSPGSLPPSIDINNLSSGLSEIRNRTLAPIFKLLKLIEQWGTGFIKLKSELLLYPEIEVLYLEPGLSFQVQFIKKDYVTPKTKFVRELGPGWHQVGTKSALSWDQVGTKLALSREMVKSLLQSCLSAQPITALMAQFNWSDRSKFKKKFINPLIVINLLSMSIPDKPNSSKQRYIITDRGRMLLKSLDENKE
jgi:predicted HTH transcriptional regulator/predicted transcriptional regulator